MVMVLMLVLVPALLARVRAPRAILRFRGRKKISN